MARFELLVSVLLFVLGVGFVIGAWHMDRLEVRQIHPASIPGLVPGLLGIALMICSALQLWGLRLANSPRPTTSGAIGSLKHLLLAALLCFAYAVLLIGQLPFVWATGLFIGTFILVFDTNFARPWRITLRRSALAIGFAAVMAYAIATLFESGFLVRLP